MADTVFIQDDGIKGALNDLIASGAIWDGCTVRIYTNNYTPTDATLLSDLTQATWSGYSAIALSAANWGAVTVASHLASSPYTLTLAFTRSVTGTAVSNFGWYITDSGNSLLYAAARFATAPLVVTNAGDAIVLSNLKATLQSVN